MSVGALSQAAPKIAVLVLDEITDEEMMREGIPKDLDAAIGSMVASPHAGMRRVALLTGSDALISGAWGERAANLRVGSLAVSGFEKRGARMAIAGAWGLGIAPGKAGFKLIKGAYSGTSSESVTSLFDVYEGIELSEFLAADDASPLLIYHSAAWGGGGMEQLQQLVGRYREAGFEQMLVIGGGKEAPIAVIGMNSQRQVPQQLPEALALLEACLFPQQEALLRSVALDRGTRHLGTWKGIKYDFRQRKNGLITFDREWVLKNGNELYQRAEFGHPKAENHFREKIDDALPLLQLQEAWWRAVEPDLKQPRRTVVLPDETVRLTIEDWAPSKLRPASEGWPEDGAIDLKTLKRVLGQLRSPAGKEFEDFTGSWPLEIAEQGNYEIILQFLPDRLNEEELAKCRAGQLTLVTGKARATMQVLEGATQFTIRMDLEKGAADLEAVLTEQIGDAAGMLGVFFVQIRRIGELKEPRVPLGPIE